MSAALPRSAPSPLDAVAHAAGRKLLGLRMTRIAGVADEHDAGNLVSDLEALWAIVDPVIGAIGDYAVENFNGIDRALFDDPLRGALEGNATYTLTSAGERIVEARQDTGAEHAREFRAAAE